MSLSKNAFSLSLFILLPSLLLLGLSVIGRRTGSAVFAPFITITDYVGETSGKIWSSIFKNEESNKRTADEILLNELLVKSRSYDDLIAQNEQLRAMLDLPALPGWNCIRAELTTHDPATWNREFWIGCGSDDGIALGNQVVSRGYLIGRVVELFNKSARVATISSPECRLSVYVQNGEKEVFPGILTGDGGLHLAASASVLVDYLSKDAVLSVDNLVLTSGLGNEVPYGTPVGTLLPDKNGHCPTIVKNAYAQAHVKPFADFTKLHFVIVYCKK
ncbi:MAG: rod shape-determining protein MreC [Victivallales bacterium]|nr:rod shape-determining protein MreC [Victivallales bacterium]